MHHRLRSVPLLLGALLASCGGEVEPSAQDPSAAPAPAPAPAPAATPPSQKAAISLVTSPDGMSAEARFGDFAWPYPTGGCSTIPWDHAASTGGLPSANAGAIHFGLPGAPSAMDLTYDASEGGYASASARPGVTSGATVHIAAEGSSEVPAFATDVVVGTPPDLIAPLAGAPIGDADLEVKWTPEDAASLLVLMNIGSGGVVCTFDAKGGHGLVPASVIRAAAADPTPCAGQCEWIQATYLRTSHVTAGAYDVTVMGSTTTARLLTRK